MGNRKAANPPPNGHVVVVGILYLHIVEIGAHQYPPGFLTRRRQVFLDRLVRAICVSDRLECPRPTPVAQRKPFLPPPLLTQLDAFSRAAQCALQVIPLA
jgi:hypothetical protein